MIPSQYVLLSRDDHQAWFIYASSSKRIIDAHVDALRYKPFGDTLGNFLEAGYTVTAKGNVDREMWQSLRMI